MSFVQLGQSAITSETAWITLAVVRCVGVIDRVVGGWPAMLRILLEDIFLGPLGIATVGLPLALPDGRVMLYGALRNVLADGDGLRQGYDWRGARGLKPCLVHHNVLMKGSELTEHGAGFCDITCHTFDSFRQWPDAEFDKVVVLLRETHDRCTAGRLTKAKAEEVARVCGFHWNPAGVVASAALRSHCSLLGAVTYDWVHTALQDGVFVIEASLIVNACGDYLEVSLVVCATVD